MTKLLVFFRVLLILVVALGPATYCYFTLEGIRSSYSAANSDCPSASTVASDVKEPPPVAGTVQKQIETLQTWALALLGGVVVLLATPNLQHFRFTYFNYVLLAPTLGLLGGSIYASLLLLRRTAYLHGVGCFTPTSSINSLLSSQTDFLIWAVVLLALFALWCLVQLSAGWAGDNPSA